MAKEHVNCIQYMCVVRPLYIYFYYIMRLMNPERHPWPGDWLPSLMMARRCHRTGLEMSMESRWKRRRQVFCL